MESADFFDFIPAITSSEVTSIPAERVASVQQRLVDEEGSLKELLFGKHAVLEKGELKVWLVNTIASLEVTDRTKQRKFLHAMESNTRNEFCAQLLLSITTSMPKEVAKLFMDKGDVFRRYFEHDIKEHNGRATSRWFAFKFNGKNEHGAMALEQYIFYYRDLLWQKLKWTGTTRYKVHMHSHVHEHLHMHIHAHVDLFYFHVRQSQCSSLCCNSQKEPLA